jgi:4-hydroxy-3-polyprenylbenzoate decarboxylase
MISPRKTIPNWVLRLGAYVLCLRALAVVSISAVVFTCHCSVCIVSYYRNLREFIETLDARGKLVRVREAVNKDTEMHSLVRLQFRGLEEEDRKAFLFEQPVDGQRRTYNIPVIIGCFAASREIYAAGLQCQTGAIGDRWSRARQSPIMPEVVSKGAVQDVVLMGESLEQRDYLSFLPIPISTPGFDNAPYTSASNWASKDLETGVQNLGTYRGQLKTPNRLGCFTASASKGIACHWEKARKMGLPCLEAALVLGGPPSISYAAVAHLPQDVDELAVAGGLGGEPLEVVRCRTVDLLVPAEADIVIEGHIATDALEPEGPFGERTGYMADRAPALFFEVACITLRQDPIYPSFLSQFPPSESSKLQQISKEQALTHLLREKLALKGVLDVALHESSGSWGYCVVRLDRKGDPWKVLEGISVHERQTSKVLIAVDEDIDARDPDAVNWALSYHMQPHRDVRIVDARAHQMDYSVAPLEHPRTGKERSSAMLVDATRKWGFPPLSLPSRSHMERALELWKAMGLPELRLKPPWYGYPLGSWSERDAIEARRAEEGAHQITGEEVRNQRVKAGDKGGSIN